VHLRTLTLNTQALTKFASSVYWNVQPALEIHSIDNTNNSISVVRASFSSQRERKQNVGVNTKCVQATQYVDPRDDSTVEYGWTGDPSRELPDP